MGRRKEEKERKLYATFAANCNCGPAYLITYIMFCIKSDYLYHLIMILYFRVMILDFVLPLPRVY